MKPTGMLLATLLLGCASGGNGSDGSNGQPGPKGDKGDPGPPGGPGQGADAAYTNGSRLRVTRTTYTADDGTIFTYTGGYFDTKTQEPCSFAVAEDGETRCLPPYIGVFAFADDACTVPLVATISQPCSQPPAHLGWAIDAQACMPGVRIYALGQPISPVTMWTINNGVCLANNPLPAPWIYYSAGPVMASSEFVAADIETDP